MRFTTILAAALLLGCATARQTPPTARGEGQRMTYNASLDKTYAALMKMFEGPGFRMTREDRVLRVEQSGGVKMDYTFYFEPMGPETTEVEGFLTCRFLSPELKAQTAYSMLRGAGMYLKEMRYSAAAGIQPVAKPAVRPSDVDLEAPKAAPRPHDYALVVGIGKYRALPEADYAERDAATFRKYLLGLGVPEQNIVHIADERAMRTDLAKYLEEWLPAHAEPDSRVFFYYSGHGAPDPKDSDAYLVPYNGDPSFLKTTAYPVKRLYEKLEALQAGEVVAFIDACYSGAGGRSVIAKGTRPLVTVVEPKVKARSRLSVLTAASGSEIAGSRERDHHGLFTYYALKGLLGAADADGDRHVSLGELYGYVSKKVAVAARGQNREQTPQLETADPSLKLY